MSWIKLVIETIKLNYLQKEMFTTTITKSYNTDKNILLFLQIL